MWLSGEEQYNYMTHPRVRRGRHTGTSYRLPGGQSNWQTTGRRPENSFSKDNQQNERSQ